jgi:hypothetical protein
MNGRIALTALAFLAAVTSVSGAQGQAVLPPGEWVTGHFVYGEGGRVYDLYRFPPGFQGLFRITVESDEFDTTVRVEALVGEVFRILADNDDCPGLTSGTDSRAYGVVRPGEIPEVHVSGWSEEDSGRYRIRLDPLPRVAPEVLPVAYGADVRGALEESDAFVNGAFEDRYRFQGAAGDVVQVLLQSEEFDPFLQLWDPETGLLAEDDDSFEIADAWLEVELPASRSYEIRVRPSPGDLLAARRMLGTYRLRMGIGLDVQPDPTLGGLAFTEEELADLRFEGGELRHEPLGFGFPAPRGEFLVTDPSDQPPEVQDPLAPMWSVRHPASEEGLLVTVTKFPRALTSTDLHRLGKSWLEMGVLAETVEERVDWEGSRSVTLRITHPWIPGGERQMRCRTSGPDRVPSLLVCLIDGGSFGRSVAGLWVR